MLKHFTLILLLSAALSALPAIVFSQMIYDTLLLSELEILASKTNYDQTIRRTTLDSAVKQLYAHNNIGEILGVYTPVYVKNYGRGGLATVSFRGTGASHTQVYWDDFLINSPMLGQVDFSQIPGLFVEEVELYYGGGSLIKAGGALGGGVSLNNDDGFSDKPMVCFQQAIGSYGFLSTTAGVNLGNDKFRSTTRFSRESARNDFTYLNTAIHPAKEMKQQNAAYRNTGFTQQFSFKPNPRQLLSVSTWSQWNDRDIPSLMTNVESGNKPIERQKDIFSRNTLTWIYQSGRSRLQLKGAWFYSYMHYVLGQEDQQNATRDTTVDSRNRTNTISTRFTFEHVFPSGVSLSSGMDLDLQSVNSNNYAGVKRRNTAGLYAMAVKEIKNRLKISALVRTALVDGEFLPVMPQVGMNLRIIRSEQLFLRWSVSRNYHLPTLNDLYWNPGGNEELKPERGFETEGGINYTKPIRREIKLESDLSVFASWIDDWILWIPSEFGYWSPQNIEKVYARGVEASLGFSGTIHDLSYRFSGQYTWTRTTNEAMLANDGSDRGDQLAYIPVHAGNGFLLLTYHRFTMNWSLNYVGARSTTQNPDEGFDALPAYLLNDLVLGKKFSWHRNVIELRVVARNIFDTQYQAILWRPMPGRNYEIVLRFELNHRK